MDPARRILVVEDDSDVRGLLLRILADEGYTVEAAATGAEAVRRLLASGFDLVILDLVLPDIAGWDVLAEMRRLPSPPPVLLLTGSAAYRTEDRAEKEGVAGYIEKPFSLRELLATCRSIVDGAAATPSKPAAERRRAPRRPLRVPAELLSEEDAWRTAGEIRDLSIGGARVAVSAPLPACERVRVAFSPSDGGGRLALHSRVHWRGPTDNGFAYGVSFLHVEASMHDRILRLLQAQP